MKDDGSATEAANSAGRRALPIEWVAGLVMLGVVVVVGGFAWALLKDRAERERVRADAQAREQREREDANRERERARAARDAEHQRALQLADARRAADRAQEERQRAQAERERADRERAGLEQQEREAAERARAERESAELAARAAEAEARRARESAKRRAEEKEAREEAENLEGLRQRKAKEKLPEVLLARAEHGASVPADDARVQAFAAALDRFAAKRATEPRDEIARLCMATVAMQREGGWPLTHEALLRDAERGMAAGGSFQRFALDYLARTSGAPEQNPTITIAESDLGDFDVGEVRIFRDPPMWQVTAQVKNTGTTTFRTAALVVEFCDAFGGVTEIGHLLFRDFGPGSERADKAFGPPINNDIRRIRFRLDFAR